LLSDGINGMIYRQDGKRLQRTV